MTEKQCHKTINYQWSVSIGKNLNIFKRGGGDKADTDNNSDQKILDISEIRKI